MRYMYDQDTLGTSNHTVERVQRMHESLEATLAGAQRAIEATHRLQESEIVQRVAAMRRLKAAREALNASVTLVR